MGEYGMGNRDVPHGNRWGEATQNASAKLREMGRRTTTRYPLATNLVVIRYKKAACSIEFVSMPCRHMSFTHFAVSAACSAPFGRPLACV